MQPTHVLQCVVDKHIKHMRQALCSVWRWVLVVSQGQRLLYNRRRFEAFQDKRLTGEVSHSRALWGRPSEHIYAINSKHVSMHKLSELRDTSESCFTVCEHVEYTLVALCVSVSSCHCEPSLLACCTTPPPL